MSEKGCVKCGARDTGTKEVAMTGTGLSKMFDLQHNTFIVVFCKKKRKSATVFPLKFFPSIEKKTMNHIPTEM